MKFLYENFLQFYLLALTSIIQRFLKNPAGILKTRIFSKTLGKGKLQE
ncbi:hypothetical protein [Spiroplasma endosymbiont of Nomada rufipes]